VSQLLVGTSACLVILVALVTLDPQWTALFWLPLLSVTLYLLVGRKVQVELRFGVGGEEERQFHDSLMSKRQPGMAKSADTRESARVQVSTTGRDG